MTKAIVSRKQKQPPTIVIDSVENDDWMKSLPGYKDEVRLHRELAAKLKRKGRNGKVVVKKT